MNEPEMNRSERDDNLSGQLADYLNQLSDVQSELLTVLGEKRECMATGKMENLNAIQDREADLCKRLQACHDRRSELLEAASQEGLPNNTLGDLAKVLPSDKSGEIKNRVEEASQRVRLLQHQSLTNWVLAQRSLLHVSQMLEIVATGGRIKPTYGISGTTHSRGSLMDQEA